MDRLSVEGFGGYGAGAERFGMRVSLLHEDAQGAGGGEF